MTTGIGCGAQRSPRLGDLEEGDLGIAKPAPEPFLTACERLGVSPERTLMVGNNRVADSGSICVGCHCLILPPVPPGATRGLRAAADMAGLPWTG